VITLARVILRNITKRYGSVIAVDHISLEVEDGEFMVLLGPSGCGKSTTLRLIAGLETPDEGEIWIGDKLVNEIDPSDRNVAMVFQSYALYPHMTAYQNIEFPLRMRGVPKEERRKRVLEVAEFLEIKDLLDRYPRQLSGGQQQRVALARALVRKPEVFLLDEPLSNLDARLRVQMRFYLRRLLHDKLRITTIYVTHDQVEAMTMADRIAVMNKGKIEQVGAPIEVFEKPANMFVASFIGTPTINFFSGVLSEASGELYLDLGVYRIKIPAKYADILKSYVGGEVILGVRPQNILIHLRSGRGYKARVTGIEPLGNETVVHFSIDGNTDYTAVIPKKLQFPMGSEIWWEPDPDQMYFFDKKTTKAIY